MFKMVIIPATCALAVLCGYIALCLIHVIITMLIIFVIFVARSSKKDKDVPLKLSNEANLSQVHLYNTNLLFLYSYIIYFIFSIFSVSLFQYTFVRICHSMPVSLTFTRELIV